MRNRGKDPKDDHWFGTPAMQQRLQEAVIDMHYLLSRGFAPKSSLQLVGNRYELSARQRKAIRGVGASANQIRKRKSSQLPPEQLSGQEILLDGFNVLIILETFLSGGYVFKGLDGCYRDISGIHSSYKRVHKTEEALLMVGRYMAVIKTGPQTWLFDRPVSNSGRIKKMLEEVATAHGFDWKVELVYNPDKALAASDQVVITSDAWVLDQANRWFNLVEVLIEGMDPRGNCLEFEV